MKNSRFEKNRKIEYNTIKDLRNLFRLKKKMTSQLKMQEIFLD